MTAKHNSPSECITKEELQRMKDKKMSPEECKAISEKVNNCVFCKRRWMQFWGEE